MDSGLALLSFSTAYLLGSIPFGLLLTRLCGLDIRSIGSGNIGATNVMRSGKKSLAIATLLLDLLKGVVAVKIAQFIYSGDTVIFAGFFAVIGHIFPIWLRFKGGKGVATTLGVFFAVNWLLALLVCAIWLCVFFATRYSSLSAILSICLSPVISYFIDSNIIVLLSLFLAFTIVFTHRQNISRLLNGTELAFRKKAS